MKLKKIVASAMAAVLLAVAISISASAGVNEGTFRGATGYRLSFKMNVRSVKVGGAAYMLTASAEEQGSKPYKYPSLYVKAVLYGENYLNSVSDKTFPYDYKGSVTVYRDSGDCVGKGFGYFKASGDAAYGDVYGTVSVGQN